MISGRVSRIFSGVHVMTLDLSSELWERRIVARIKGAVLQLHYGRE
jgi:hypothetical protein